MRRSAVAGLNGVNSEMCPLVAKIDLSMHVVMLEFPSQRTIDLHLMGVKSFTVFIQGMVTSACVISRMVHIQFGYPK